MSSRNRVSGSVILTKAKTSRFLDGDNNRDSSMKICDMSIDKGSKPTTPRSSLSRSVLGMFKGGEDKEKRRGSMARGKFYTPTIILFLI